MASFNFHFPAKNGHGVSRPVLARPDQPGVGVAHRELLRLLVPIGEEPPLLLVDLQVGNLEADGFVRVAREQQVLNSHRRGVDVDIDVDVGGKPTRQATVQNTPKGARRAIRIRQPSAHPLRSA